MTDLGGKVAVVTGASRGLGQRVAIRLAAHGAALMLVGRSEATLAATADSIVEKGGCAEFVTANLSDPHSVGAVVVAANRIGPPSILVNAAGVFGPIQLIKDSDPREWIETLMTNMVSYYLTCRAFVGGMIDQGWGRIVNVTSANALHPPGPLHSAYGTSKAALNHFTRHLAAEGSRAAASPPTSSIPVTSRPRCGPTSGPRPGRLGHAARRSCNGRIGSKRQAATIQKKRRIWS
jgi:NAD(P)-dependent dehydrogenase (short-subunit alcohol dehydrogenase family)